MPGAFFECREKSWLQQQEAAFFYFAGGQARTNFFSRMYCRYIFALVFGIIEFDEVMEMPSLHSARPSRPQKGRWHVIQSLFFIFIFSLAVFFFLQSSVFRVKEVKVQGNNQLSGEQVVALSGLETGVNIFKANLPQAQSKLALNPIVKQVAITRHLPATIVIDLTERKAIGLMANSGGFIAVGDDGYCLALVNNLASINLPIITGVKPAKTMPGQRINDEKLKAALAYLTAMPLNMRAAVSEINVTDLNNIRMFSIDEAEVRFGDVNRIAEKVKLYQEVTGQKYGKKIHYIDISFKGDPVIKFMDSPK